MPTHDIVVIGASAGGIEALTTLVAALPAQLPAAIFVVVHIPPNASSALAKILDHAGPLPARPARDGAPITPGSITVATPDHHLLLTADQVRVVRGPHENYHRPAIDPLFRTAALAFGPRVVGIVLSGALNDGTAGLRAIKQQGGIAMVQDPATALFPSMPQSACTYVAVDWCLPVPAISAKVAELAVEEVTGEEGAYPMSDEMMLEAKMAGLDPTVLDQEYRPGTLTSFTCPECSGPLWELQDGELQRFRCRVGHAFTLESMAAGREESIEDSLWMAINSLTETAQMYERLAVVAETRAQHATALKHARKAHQFQERAQKVRQMLLADAESVFPEVAPAEDVAAAD